MTVPLSCVYQTLVTRSIKKVSSMLIGLLDHMLIRQCQRDTSGWTQMRFKNPMVTQDIMHAAMAAVRVGTVGIALL